MELKPHAGPDMESINSITHDVENRVKKLRKAERDAAAPFFLQLDAIQHEVIDTTTPSNETFTRMIRWKCNANGTLDDDEELFIASPLTRRYTEIMNHVCNECEAISTTSISDTENVKYYGFNHNERFPGVFRGVFVTCDAGVLRVFTHQSDDDGHYLVIYHTIKGLTDKHENVRKMMFTVGAHTQQTENREDRLNKALSMLTTGTEVDTAAKHTTKTEFRIKEIPQDMAVNSELLVFNNLTCEAPPNAESKVYDDAFLHIAVTGKTVSFCVSNCDSDGHKNRAIMHAKLSRKQQYLKQIIQERSETMLKFPELSVCCDGLQQLVDNLRTCDRNHLGTQVHVEWGSNGTTLRREMIFLPKSVNDMNVTDTFAAIYDRMQDKIPSLAKTALDTIRHKNIDKRMSEWMPSITTTAGSARQPKVFSKLINSYPQKTVHSIYDESYSIHLAEVSAVPIKGMKRLNEHLGKSYIICLTKKNDARDEDNDGVYVLIRVFVAPPDETTLLVVHHGETSNHDNEKIQMYSIPANVSFDLIQMTSEASVDFMCYMQNLYVQNKNIQGFNGVDPLCKNVHDVNLRAMQSKATYGSSANREITTSVLIMKGLSKQRHSSRSTNSNSSRRSSRSTQPNGQG